LDFYRLHGPYYLFQITAFAGSEPHAIEKQCCRKPKENIKNQKVYSLTLKGEKALKEYQTIKSVTQA